LAAIANGEETMAMKNEATDVDATRTRRRLLGVFGGMLAAVGLVGAARAAAPTGEVSATRNHARDHEDHKGRHDRHHGRHTSMWQVVARQEIMELRHAYGIATDLVGKNTAESIEAGRVIYRRIFTDDARIGAAGVDTVTGPDAWVDIVKTALAPYNATQHLIGTQYITGLNLPDAEGVGGVAHMTSYLQAWHAKASGDLWLFMGTYEDDLVYTQAGGWQIRAMMLHQVSSDYRKLGQQPG
jgi:SnoaL-like domain